MDQDELGKLGEMRKIVFGSRGRGEGGGDRRCRLVNDFNSRSNL